MKKWLSRIFKILLVLGILFAIMLTMMVNMGGSSDTLKRSLEDYLSSATGYRANVETLQEMTFFPTITVDAQNIVMTHPTDPQKIIRAETALMKLGFWDVMLKDRAIKNLQIEHVTFAPGTAFEETIYIEELAVDETADGRAFLALDGMIGETPLHGEITLTPEGGIKSRSYKIDEDSELTAEIGDIYIAGTLNPRALGGFYVTAFRAGLNDQDAVSGQFYIVRDGDKNIAIKGTFDSVETDSSAQADITVSHGETLVMNGDLEAKILDMNDFKNGARLAALIQEWQDIFNPPVIDIMLDVTAEQFINEGETLNDTSLTLKRENETLTITPKN